MQCMSCETEVNPKWQHAIDQNVCPFCGNHIMDDVLKDLLSTLTSTMLQLQSYPDQLNDWMLSNHSFIRTDSPSLPLYLPDDYEVPRRRASAVAKHKVIVVNDNGEEEEVESEVMMDQKSTNSFFERAGAIDPKKGIRNPSDINESIKKKMGELSAQSSGGYSEIIGEDDVDVDVESMFGQSSALTSTQYDDDSNLPPTRIQNMMNNLKKSNKSKDELSDLIEKVEGSKGNFNSGGGAFRRS